MRVLQQLSTLLLFIDGVNAYQCLSSSQRSQSPIFYPRRQCLSHPSASNANAQKCAFWIRTRQRDQLVFSSKIFHSSPYSSTSDGIDGVNSEPSPVLQEISKLVQRTSWFSWWAQTILTVISCTILLFARNATKNGPNGTPSFFLSGLGVTASFLSILWTWGNGARLSRRLLRNKKSNAAVPETSNTNTKSNDNLLSRGGQGVLFSPATPKDLLRRAIRVQVSINLVGLLLNLLAAQEIVGSLALKVLTAGNLNLYGGATTASTPAGFIQPLDILVVQANTNTLLSHFMSLSSSLYLADRARVFLQQLQNQPTPVQPAPQPRPPLQQQDTSPTTPEMPENP